MKRRNAGLTRLSKNYHRPLRPVRLRRRSRWWRWVMAIGVGIFLILGWTWKGVYVDTLRIKKSRLSTELEELQGQQKHLTNRMTTLRSFARIDRLARENLHMQYANRPPRILQVPGLEIGNEQPGGVTDRNPSLASIK